MPLNIPRAILMIAAVLPALAGCRSAPPSPDYADSVGDVTGADIDVRLAERPAEGVDAGEPEPPGVLTPAEALRRAVLHDPRLQSALARVRVAYADAAQSRLLPNPILTVGMRFREAGAGTPITDAAIAQDVIVLLLRPRHTAAPDNRLRAAAAQVLTTLADVVTETQESYVTIQALTAELAALEDRRGLAERLVGLGRARLNAGEASRLDLMALETQLLELDVDLAQRRQEMIEARLTLARLLGEPSSAAAWALAPWPATAPSRASEVQWLARALQDRSEIRAKEWELAALGDGVALTRLGMWEGTDVGVQSEYDQGWSVGPQLTVPLPFFDWGQAKRAKATAELDDARHQMTHLRRQIVQEVRTQHAAYDATLRTLATARDELLPLQLRRAGQAEASYKAGETDVSNLLLAQEDLADTRVKVIDLQKKSALARVKLQRAVGGVGIADQVESVPPATRATSGPAKPAQEMRP
jgi:cobalt-zinc-cadmium efflux system outer membrane protein